jgi:hypothetical protein
MLNKRVSVSLGSDMERVLKNRQEIKEVGRDEEMPCLFTKKGE